MENNTWAAIIYAALIVLSVDYSLIKDNSPLVQSWGPSVPQVKTPESFTVDLISSRLPPHAPFSSSSSRWYSCSAFRLSGLQVSFHWIQWQFCHLLQREQKQAQVTDFSLSPSSPIYWLWGRKKKKKKTTMNGQANSVSTLRLSSNWWQTLLQSVLHVAWHREKKMVTGKGSQPPGKVC